MVHTLRAVLPLRGLGLSFRFVPKRCIFLPRHSRLSGTGRGLWKAFGRLVPLGFAIAGFTPAAYLRRSLRRPSILEILSWGGLRA